MVKVYKALPIISTFILATLPLGAAQLNVNQMFSSSTYVDVGDTESHYIVPLNVFSFYHLDLRLQEVGEEKWQMRSTFRQDLLFTGNNVFKPILRQFYVENKDPLFNHFYVTAGRMLSFNMLPVHQFDGAMLSYTPSKNSPFKTGLFAGREPKQNVGYRDREYLPYHTGAFVEYRAKKGEIKTQYDGSFNRVGSFSHNALVQGGLRYNLFKAENFLRAGASYTAPQNLINYAFIENTIKPGKTSTHSIGYMQSETNFVLADSIEKVKYQKAFYTIYFTSLDKLWKINATGGYIYSMETHGYTGKAQVMRNSLFLPTGAAGATALIEKNGQYRVASGRLSYGLYPLKIINLEVFGGFENYQYRQFLTNGIVYGVNIEGGLPGNISLSGELEGRVLLGGNHELSGQFLVTHFFRMKIGRDKEEEQRKEQQNTGSKENSTGEQR